MFIFDELVESVNQKIKEEAKSLPLLLNVSVKEDKNQFIFPSEKAFELGVKPHIGTSLSLLTDESFPDEIVLLGEDLNELKEYKNYARIVIGSIDTEKMGEKNAFYNNIRKFDYVKYHFAYPETMVRVSSFNNLESLLMSKKGAKEGIDFSKLGSYFISKYKELPFVKSVKMIFITSDYFPYSSLSAIQKKAESITKALDHLMNNVKMDCHSCALQVICSEVEKKVENDFKK